MTLNAKILRLCVTAVVAFAVGKLVYVPLFFVLWPGLYLAWGYWSRRRAGEEPGAPGVVAEKDLPGASGVAAADRRSAMRRNILITGIVVAGFITASFLHLYLSQKSVHRSVEKARSSVQAGMSVGEVFHSVTGWISLGTSSDAPETDPEHLHAVNLAFHAESKKFSYFDKEKSADREISESEALGVLHEKLGDGTIWRLRYTFLTSTPQHFSFTVIFDRNGRVQEVTPIHGWD